MTDDHADRPAETPRLRVGHDERTAAMKALDEHLEAGRLDVTTYSDRSATAGAAVYRDELDALFTDLRSRTSPRPGRSSRPGRTCPRGRSGRWR